MMRLAVSHCRFDYDDRCPNHHASCRARKRSDHRRFSAARRPTVGNRNNTACSWR